MYSQYSKGLLLLGVFIATGSVTDAVGLNSEVTFTLGARQLESSYPGLTLNPYANIYVSSVLQGRTVILNGTNDPDWPDVFTIQYASEDEAIAVAIGSTADPHDLNTVKADERIGTVIFTVGGILPPCADHEIPLRVRPGYVLVKRGCNTD